MPILREEIIERYRFPRHRGIIRDPQTQGEVANSLCGDELTLFLRLGPVRSHPDDRDAISPSAEWTSNGMDEKKEKVVEAKFQGEGCALMTASADILCGALSGKTKEELRSFSAEDMLSLYGEHPSPSRLKCVLLPYEALKRALAALF